MNTLENGEITVVETKENGIVHRVISYTPKFSVYTKQENKKL